MILNARCRLLTIRSCHPWSCFRVKVGVVEWSAHRYAPFGPNQRSFKTDVNFSNTLLPLPSEARERLPEIAPADLDALESQARLNPYLEWTFRRALWVHGLDSLADYLQIAGEYSLAGRAEQIRCPTLVA